MPKKSGTFRCIQRCKKVLALLVAFFYGTSTVLFAQVPSVSFQSSPSQEILMPSLADDLLIPAAMGAVQKVHSSGPVTVTLIQDAHAQLGAQKNIQKLLRHLGSRNAIDALFLEGAFQGPLPKDRLHFKKNARSNQRLVEKFFKKGLISGAGMYLSENKKPAAAYGLEDPELYTQNLKQLRTVFLRRSLSGAFLSDLKARIFGINSRISNPDLRKFLREWDACLEARRDLLQYFALLSRYANRVLQLDLEDAWNQFEYPQLVRFFKIQQLESKLKGESVKLAAEKDALLVRLRSSRGPLHSERSGFDVSPSALESVLGLNPDTVPGDLRAYFENFYLTYKDSGFEFSSYPALKLYIAKLILAQEFDAQKMTEEAEAVTERILGKMAAGKQEKQLVEHFKNYHLLKKLFALELQRKEFAEVEKKIKTLAPGSLSRELQLSSGSSAAFGDSVFNQAVQFYRTAVRREEAMFRNMTETLKTVHAKKSAWVIGGFHTEGIENRLKEHGFSVVTLAPKISEIQSDQNYKDILTLQHAESLNESTVPAYSLDRVSLAELGRYDARGAAYLLQVVLHELQRSVAIMAREGDGDKREFLPRMTVPLVPLARSELRSEESFTAHVGSAMSRLQERTGYAQTFQFDRMIPVEAYEQIRLSFSDSSEQGNFARNFKKWGVYVYPIASDQTGLADKSMAERLKGSKALFLKSKDHGVVYPASWPKVLAGLRFEFERLPGTKDQPPAMPGHFDLLGELVDGKVFSEVPPVKQGTKPETRYEEDPDYFKGMSLPLRREPKWIRDYAQRSLAFSSTLPLNWLQDLRKQVETMQQSAELDLHGLKAGTPLQRWLGTETQLEVHMMRVRKVLKEAGTRFRKLAQEVSVLSDAAKDAGAGPLAGLDFPEEPYESSPLIKVSAAVQEPWRLAEEIVHKAIQDHFKKTYAQIPTKAIRYQGQSAAVERLAELNLAGHALTSQMIKIETDPGSNGTLHFTVSVNEPAAGTAAAVLPKIPEGQHRQESSRRIIDRWNYISQAAHEPWNAFQDQLRVLHTTEVALEKSVRDHAETKYFDHGELKASIAKLNFLKEKVFNRMADAFMRAADYFPYMEPREYLDKYARRAQAETPASTVSESRPGLGETIPSHMPKGTLQLLGRRVPPLGIMDLSSKLRTPVKVPARSEIRRDRSAEIPAPTLRILQEVPVRSGTRAPRAPKPFPGIAKLAVFGVLAWGNIKAVMARSEQRENFAEAHDADRDAPRESLSLRIFRHRISALFLTFLVFVSSIPSAVAQIAMSILNVPETREVVVTAHVPADLPEGNLEVQGTQDFSTWTTLTNFSVSGVNRISSAYSFVLPMSEEVNKMFFRSAFWFTAPATNIFSQTSTTNQASGTTNRVGLMGVTGKPENSVVMAASPIMPINHKVTVAWDRSPEPNVNYQVNFYTVSGVVTNSGALTNIANSVTNFVDTSTNTFATITNLQEGATYAVFVIAVDPASGFKSEPSNTITYTVPGPTQPAVVTYPENFGRLSSLTGWTNALGQWSVVDGKAKHVSGDKGILVMDFLWGTQYDAFQGEFDFHTPALDSERGIVFGFQNAQNYYWAGIDRLSGKYRVVCIQKGIRKVLNEAPAAAFADETTHTIKVSRNGITSALYFDGNLVLEAQDPEDTFGKGRVGFYSGSPEHTLDNSLLIQSYTEAPDSTNAPVMTPGIHFLPLYSMTQQLTLQGFKELSTSVWINGQQVSPSDESTVWSTPVILTDGLNTFTILAKNSDSVESEPWTFTITLDRVAPVITLTSSGVVSNNTYVLSYTVDGIPQTDTRTLVDGENLIPVSAVDAAGNITSTTFRVVVDKTPPQVNVISADSATSADYVLRYTVDGVEKTRNVTLAEGLNQLPISEVDAAGNKTELTFSVTLDTIGPVVALAMATPSLINVNSITVHYTVDGVAKAKLFEGLVEGDNILTITEMDQLGNQTTASKVVTVDTIAPVVVLDASTPSLINEKTLTVSYTVDGVAKTKLFVGLVEGQNTLTITETDLAGNQTTVEKTVTVDTLEEEILPVIPGASFLNPEQFAASGAQNGIRDVIRGSGGRITRITTEDKIFDYGYDASGRLEKVTQSRPGTQELGATDLARTGTASASSQAGSYSASMAIDGTGPSQDFGWISAASPGTNDWLRLDLGREVDLAKIKYDTHFGPPYMTLIWQLGFKISVSVDGVNWTEVVSRSGETGPQLYEFSLAPVRARYIKVHAIESTFPAIPGWNYAYVGGLEAYERSQVINTIAEKEYVYTYDANGRVEKLTGASVGTSAPAVVLDASTPSLINVNTLTVHYTVNGVPKAKLFEGLVEGNNTLTILEMDSTGNQTLINRIITVDTVAPVVTLDADTPSLITVTSLAIHYTVDGVAKTKDFTGLVEGANTLTIIETDLAGNQTVVTKVVTVNAIGPVVVLDAATPSLINTKTLTVQYTVDGVAKTKLFTGLVEGQNTLTITETDQAGNQTTISKIVTVDTIGPTVVLDAGTPNLIDVKTLTIQYTVDGVAKTKDFTGLVEGQNTLTITETDQAGNQTTISKIVTVDTIGPTVVLDASTPSLINVKALTVNYTVDGVSKQKVFTGLVEGQNALTITETDQAGNQTTVSKIVTVDTIGPTVVLDGATPNLINAKTLTVQYTVDGVAKTKLFTDLVEGQNTLTITEADQAGNQTTVSKIVTVDTIGPAVVLDASTPSLINVKTLTVQYTVDGVAKAKLFVGLVEGENTLTITETDLAGNQTVVTRIVTVSILLQEVIMPDTPGAPYLNPEQFAASGTQNGILNVVQTDEGRITRITTASEVFDYTYDASGRLEKVTQSRSGTQELGETDLVKSGTASASSQLAGYDAAKAIDEIGPAQDYGWISAVANGTDDWLRVDLGKEINLGKIKYDTRFGLSFSTSIWQRGFKISVSVDGLNWTEAVSRSGETSPQLYEFSLTPMKARYIKVHAIDSVYPGNPDWNYAYVSGLEAYETKQGADAVVEKEYVYHYDANGRLEKVTQSRLGTQELGVEDLARTGTASASSQAGSYSASMAIDGTGPSQDFGWIGAASPGTDDWLRLDLGREVDLAKIKYDSHFGPPYLTSIWQSSFKISVSVDGVNWTEVVSRSGETGPQLYEFSLTPVRARYIKVHAIESTFPAVPGWNYAYVGGLEAYERSQVVHTIAEKEYVYTYDANGRVEKVTGASVGTSAPAVVLDTSTPNLINVNTLTVNYSVNGVAKTRLFEGLVDGENILAITETDQAGNQTTVNVYVTVAPRSEIRVSSPHPQAETEETVARTFFDHRTVGIPSFDQRIQASISIALVTGRIMRAGLRQFLERMISSRPAASEFRPEFLQNGWEAIMKSVFPERSVRNDNAWSERASAPYDRKTHAVIFVPLSPFLTIEEQKKLFETATQDLRSFPGKTVIFISSASWPDPELKQIEAQSEGRVVLIGSAKDPEQFVVDFFSTRRKISALSRKRIHGAVQRAYANIFGSSGSSLKQLLRHTLAIAAPQVFEAPTSTLGRISQQFLFQMDRRDLGLRYQAYLKSAIRVGGHVKAAEIDELLKKDLIIRDQIPGRPGVTEITFAQQGIERILSVLRSIATARQFGRSA